MPHTFVYMRHFLNRGLERLGFRLSKTTEVDMLDFAIRRRLHADFCFVQIGANDGLQSDPIRSYAKFFQWRGLLVEPVKDYFDECVANYRDCPRLKFVNAAITEDAGPVTIYRVNPSLEGTPSWLKGIASLSPGHHRLSGTPDEMMISETVPGITLAQLLEDHDISSLDLLQIDAEGHDVTIVKSIDFDRIQPSIIHFEHRMNNSVHARAEVESVLGLLLTRGYKLFVNESDCLAYL